MNIEEKQPQESDGLNENSSEGAGEFPKASTGPVVPLKVSDDSNSDEILVFTSACNVCKVQKKDIRDKFQSLQKIALDEGEKPIYLTGNKNYAGFLIVAFENGRSER